MGKKRRDVIDDLIVRHATIASNKPDTIGYLAEFYKRFVPEHAMPCWGDNKLYTYVTNEFLHYWRKRHPRTSTAIDEWYKTRGTVEMQRSKEIICHKVISDAMAYREENIRTQ